MGKARRRGVEGGGDLGRVVGVVVDQGHPVDLAHDREAAPDAGERGEGLLADVERHRELVRDRDRGQAVEHVVRPRHAEGEAPHRLAPTVRVEARLEPAVVDAAHRVVGLRRDPVRDVATLDLGQDVLDVGVVEAQDRQAVERHPRAELDERRLEDVVAVPVVEVLGVDVGDHGHGGGQVHEAAVALVGLGHQQVSAAEPRVGPERLHLAPDGDGRIQARGAEHRGHERRRRRLAVRARDGDPVLDPHQPRRASRPGR